MFAATRVAMTSKVSGYRYWRIYITAVNNGGSQLLLAELEARLTLGGADQTAPSTTMYASIWDTGQTPDLAVDNNTGTYWTATVSGPWWIEMDLVTPVNLAQIALTRQNTSNGFNRAPRDFIVQGSNDRSSYTNVQSFSVADWTSVTQVFNV